MKKLAPAIIMLVMAAWPSSCPAFLDYLFGGSASRDAIDNSAVGDLRAWWTGNPAYQFNPWYTPSQPGAAPGAAGQQQPGQQGSYTITPSPTGQAPYGQPGAPQYSSQPMQGYGQPTYGGYAQQGMEQQAPQQYQMPPQQYQAAPQQYPAAPQYQTMPPQYQAAPQYQAMPQQYPAAPQQYQYPQQYQSVPQGYQPVGQ